LQQEPKLDESKTVIEIVKEGMKEAVDALADYNAINDAFGLPEHYEDADKMEKLMKEQGVLQDKIEALGAWDIDTKLNIALDALRCPEPDANISVLSGGEKRRVALCRLLLQEPEMTLLDEPTNHLDAESVLWLEQHLSEYKGTVIAITHDRYFRDNVAGWILELDRGEGIPWEGNYSAWLEQKSKRLAQEEKTESKRRKTLERELEWVRMSPNEILILYAFLLETYVPTPTHAPRFFFSCFLFFLLGLTVLIFAPTMLNNFLPKEYLLLYLILKSNLLHYPKSTCRE
jgi:ATPase subunit of ABC transporter with duplicated ATPase domains